FVMGQTIVWLVVMVPISLLFTGIGIYAWNRKKPMWFWTGTEVSEDEIKDVRAYNRANGLMWIAFSLVFWVSTILGIFQIKWAGIFMIIGGIGGGFLVMLSYVLIYKKYKV
ncbi:MAG: hypothetical protein K5776_06840, partial [Lachnospiraceae bacterium]|nr:hypothetical protein [Lachnospiraceae bacterium]